MFYKAVVFLTFFVCVVRASVIVNIFDDDVEPVHSTVRSCNLRWCQQQCRRMGFTGGVCVGDRCKCDSRINKIGVASDIDVDDVSFSLRSCNIRWCDQNCRRMGFTGGVCVGDRCKCDMNKIGDVSDLETDISILSMSCKLRWCDIQCQRMGFTGGVCVGDRCKCYIKPKYGDASDIDVDDVSFSLRSCNLRWCEQTCRRKGFNGGVCVGDHCKCDINIGDAEASDAEAASSSLRSCNLRWCEQNCRRMGFNGGVCVGDRCKCDMNKIGDVSDVGASDVDEAVSSLKTCDLRWCEQTCRRNGFSGGVCRGDRCKCYINKVEDADASDVEAASSSLRRCNLRWCEQNCQRMGFTGGVCVGDRCKCDMNKIGDVSDVGASDVDEAVSSLKTCDLRWCEQTCRRNGFSGGVCRGDRCKCYINKVEDADASDVEAASSSLRRCNLRWCEQNCQRMGFTGGVCVGDRCKCDMNKIGDVSDEGASDVDEAISSLKSCDLRWCEQTCRRKGFTGGVCRGDRCKCDINKIEDIKSENEIPVEPEAVQTL